MVAGVRDLDAAIVHGSRRDFKDSLCCDSDCRQRWMPIKLSPMQDKTTRPKDEIVVFEVVRPTACSECGEDLGKGCLLRLEQEKALCMACADLDRLEFLPSGDQAVTRRASKYSKLRAVVVHWSRETL